MRCGIGCEALVVACGLFCLTLPSAAGQAQAALPSASQPCLSRQLGVKFPRPQRYPAQPGAAKALDHRPTLATRLDRTYRTTIREAAAAGPDFAGHYAVAKWGCGTGCLGFVIADLQSGRVYDPPFDEVDFHYPDAATSGDPGFTCFEDLVNYDLRSRLLVVEGCLAGKACGRHFFLMGSDGLHPIAFDPDRSPGSPRQP